MGLSEPENPSLRHINGKIQISKTQIIKQTSNFQNENSIVNPTLNIMDILIENKQFESTKQIPTLEFAGLTSHLAVMTQIGYDAKIDYSDRFKVSPRKHIETRYYQPRQLVRPDLLMIKDERTKPVTKPRQIVADEPTPQVKPRYTVPKEDNSITSTESNIKNELEIFSSTSSSSNLSTSSSNRSSSSSSYCVPTQGIVSQMRNIFESPEKTKNYDFIFSKKKLFNNYETALCTIKKQPIYENLNFLKNDPIVDLGPPPAEPPPPPLPMSPPPGEDDDEILEESLHEPKQRLLSATSSCTNYTIKSDFKILSNDRCVTPCSKSITGTQNLLIKGIPDSVDEVKFQYEGQRHVVVPGYMTSADILRNILLKNNSSLPVNLKKSEPAETLKEKLLKLNEKDDEFLSKKFSQKPRTRTLSGVINLEQNDFVDIDLDYETKPPTKPPRTFDSGVDDKMYSVRTVSSRGSTRKAPNSKCITGSFDPNDFDSFDEDDFEPISQPKFDQQIRDIETYNYNQVVQPPERSISIEPFEKIMDDGFIQQKIEADLKKQEDNLIQFDPNDFDSFDEDVPEPEYKPPVQQCASNTGFLRSAFDRLSVKTRSSSVPMRNFYTEKQDKPANQKTLNLMSKMQTEIEEKHKNKKEKRNKKLEEEKKKLNEQTHRKSLTSILNFFTLSNNPSSSSSNTEMVKNENKRLSLRKLKAKKKTKNSENFDYQSDFDSQSNRSLNLESEPEDMKQNLFNQARSSGRIKNELVDKKQNLKPDIMQQLRAELDEEIKDRQMLEKKNDIIQSSNFSRRSSNRESTSSKKIRSKSVTFLDELSSEEENFQSTNCLQEESRPSLRAGDARLFAGALTGAGPVRSIIKKSMNDLGVIENVTDQLPKVKLDCLDDDMSITKLVKSQTTPNFRRKEQIFQSDL